MTKVLFFLTSIFNNNYGKYILVYKKDYILQPLATEVIAHFKNEKSKGINTGYYPSRTISKKERTKYIGDIKMKQILPVIFLSLIIAACSTMPKEIEDRYLAEKTESDTKSIYSLEQKIIDKNKEKQTVESKMKEQAKLPEMTKEEIKLLEEENDVLKDQVYYYEKNKDAVNLEAKKIQLLENNSALAKKTALFEYQKSEKNLLEAELGLKTAELAEYISELNSKKSKIAKIYRDKNEPAEPEKEDTFFTKLLNKINPKDPDDVYGYKKYDEYLDKKKQETAKALFNYEEADIKFKSAKTALEKIK